MTDLTQPAAAADPGASAATGDSATGSAAESAPTTIGAVDRAVDVLLLFGRSLQPSLGVTEIAHELGMPKSGVHRVLSTLRRRRLVTYDPDTRKYALGQAAISLSQAYVTRVDVQSLASETLAALMRSTGETATLAVRRHGTFIFRAQQVPDRELRLEVRLARSYPLHLSASGKTFLAHLPAEETDDYLARTTLEAATPSTVVDVAVLRRELDLVRAAGFATSEGERIVGVSSVAAPVLNYDGYPVCVVAVSGPSARVDVRDEDLRRTVRGAARGLSEEMGHRLL